MMTSVIKDALTMFINSNLNRYSTCCRTAHKKDLADKKTLREHTTLSKNKEKKKERGREENQKKHVITRRNLTQDKQLTKHAQKLITAFTKRMSMNWILNRYACPGDEPRCKSLAITTKEEEKRNTYVHTTYLVYARLRLRDQASGRINGNHNCSIICGTIALD